MTTWLASSALNFMRAQSRAYQPLETGGILLGWRRGEVAVIAAALGPGPNALHGRHLFIPDDRWHTEQVENAFAGSGGDLDYLGDWHSHPGGIAAMSAQDHLTLVRITQRIGVASMIILAGDLAEEGPIGSWIGRKPRRLFGRVSVEAAKLKAVEMSEQGWPDWQSSAAGYELTP